MHLIKSKTAYLHFLLLGIIFLIPIKSSAQLVNPPCTNTVCVNADMLAVAQHRDVDDNGYPSYYIQLHPAIPCADTTPQETGLEVHKQVQRGLLKFTDTLCTGQGCHPAPNPDGGARLCVE